MDDIKSERRLAAEQKAFFLFLGANPKGVNACGILGIDEFKYNIPLTAKK
ncbi:MAG: hypothetical protein HY360_16455 [Verrucomicrobia bacterium]|nr:hypothetical protein [Verrucomicrobiota bacterium]